MPFHSAVADIQAHVAGVDLAGSDWVAGGDSHCDVRNGKPGTRQYRYRDLSSDPGIDCVRTDRQQTVRG